MAFISVHSHCMTSKTKSINLVILQSSNLSKPFFSMNVESFVDKVCIELSRNSY